MAKGQLRSNVVLMLDQMFGLMLDETLDKTFDQTLENIRLWLALCHGIRWLAEQVCHMDFYVNRLKNKTTNIVIVHA